MYFPLGYLTGFTALMLMYIWGETTSMALMYVGLPGEFD